MRLLSDQAEISDLIFVTGSIWMRVQLMTNARLKVSKIYNKIINLLVDQMGPPLHRFIIRCAALLQTTALASTCFILTPGLGPSLAQADVVSEVHFDELYFNFYTQVIPVVSDEVALQQIATFSDFSAVVGSVDGADLRDDGKTLDLGIHALVLGRSWGVRGGTLMVSEGEHLRVGNGITISGGSELAVTGAEAKVETFSLSVSSYNDQYGKLSIAEGGVVSIGGHVYSESTGPRGQFWLGNAFDARVQAELEIDGSGSLFEITPENNNLISFVKGSRDPAIVTTSTITVANGGVFRIDEAAGDYYQPRWDGTKWVQDYISPEEANASTYGNNHHGRLTFNIGAASGEAAVAAGFVDFYKPLPLGGATSQLVFNHTNTDYEFGTAISGAGSVLVENGTTILTHENSYTGGTTITGGTLRLADGGSIVGNIINNSTNSRGLVFAPSEALTYGDVISGTGGLTIEGPGRLTLTGANSYTGGTTVTAGTLRLADGGSVTGDMTVTGGTLQVDDGGSITGNTTVSGGVVLVNGSLYGITLNDGGVLGGDGTVGGVSVNSGATLAPGNSIGTLNVDGDITLSAGSSYAVEVNRNGAADLLAIDGAVTIDQGAIVHVSAEHATDTGFYYAPSTAYTILTADSHITGTFGGVTDSFAFLDSTLDYRTPNQVILVLERNLTSLADVAVTENQRNVAIAVSSLNASNDVLNAVMGLSADDARSAYDSLSGEIHPSVDGLLIQDSSLGRTAANNRLRSAFDGVAPNEQQAIAQDRSGGSSMGWFEGYGQWSEISETDDTAAIDSQTVGFFAGVDTQNRRGWQVGLFAGYGNSSVAVDKREASGDANSFTLGAYAGYQLNDFDFRFGASNAWHKVTTDRTVTVGGFSDELSADYAANTFQAFGEVGYTHTTQLARIEPFTGLALINQRTHDFVEAGGAAALSTGTSSHSVGVFSLGTRFERQLQIVGSDATLLNGSLGWHRALGDLDPVKTMRFNDSSIFDVAGTPVEKDTLLVELGLRHQVDGVLFNLSYYSAFGDLAQNQGFSIDASIRF
ncbi:autotransporter domain-containing protein [uncultured Tateyamaria sp.]|uniref:autotransporter outer membrane beta-barrel domain-containing protein n=1 Tax=uncultured Tateyamaria sp. TaxID=455651 RepID=UPI002622A119|nr:autotransporter domain-containing protein [uncultured Tateyamaria sp.]